LEDDELANTRLGTPLNKAPEIHIKNDYDSKCDIYSLGVCFYQMIYGVYPFTAETIAQLV
jgi:serine/threonine protein kinase